MDQNNFGIFPEQKTELLTEELLNNDLETLKKKYGQGRIFEIIFKPDKNLYSVANNLKMRIHGFASNYYPTNQSSVLPLEKELAITGLVAKETEERDGLEVALKKIDPNLIIPANYDSSQFKTRAEKLSLAQSTVETVLLNNLALEYLPDTINFLKLDKKELQEISQNINIISNGLTNYLKEWGANPRVKMDDNLVNQCAELFEKIGRTPFFVQQEKEKQNITELINLMAKIEVATNIALTLKENNIPLDSLNKDEILSRIKNFIKPMINI